jgi:hypothetical protein
MKDILAVLLGGYVFKKVPIKDIFPLSKKCPRYFKCEITWALLYYLNVCTPKENLVMLKHSNSEII